MLREQQERKAGGIQYLKQMELNTPLAKELSVPPSMRHLTTSEGFFNQVVFNPPGRKSQEVILSMNVTPVQTL